jgi:hypothetical protein
VQQRVGQLASGKLEDRQCLLIAELSSNMAEQLGLPIRVLPCRQVAHAHLETLQQKNANNQLL